MTKIAEHDIKKVPLADIQGVLNLVDAALDGLSSIWSPVQGLIVSA